MITLAFLHATIRAVSLPMPVFPPVITTVLPTEGIAQDNYVIYRMLVTG